MTFLTVSPFTAFTAPGALFAVDGLLMRLTRLRGNLERACGFLLFVSATASVLVLVRAVASEVTLLVTVIALHVTQVFLLVAASGCFRLAASVQIRLRKFRRQLLNFSLEPSNSVLILLFRSRPGVRVLKPGVLPFGLFENISLRVILGVIVQFIVQSADE